MSTGPPCSLTVAGFSGHLAALNGVYQQGELNHTKPTYKKHAELDGTTTCCVYYWEDKANPAMSGWWMAPEVGGMQVWAHAVSHANAPPTRGWRVPWNTKIADPNISMELKQVGGNPLTATAGSLLTQSKMLPPGDPRIRAQREKNLVQVNAGVTTAENAVNKLTAPQADNITFDKARHMTMAKSAIASAQRCLDGHLKTGGLDEDAVSLQRSKLNRLNTELQHFEQSHADEQKSRLDHLKNTYIMELTELVMIAEKLVDKTKDAAALFTCEMADHIRPEDALEAKERTDHEAAPAQESLKKAKDLLFSKEREIRSFPPADVAPVRESIKPLNNRLALAEKELSTVKQQAAASVRRAQQMLAKKKREEEVLKAKDERERITAWNKNLIAFAYITNLVADEHLVKTEPSEDNFRAAEASVLGFRDELLIRQINKDCLPATKTALLPYMDKLETVAQKLRLLLKEVTDQEDDNIRRSAVDLAVAAQYKKGPGLTEAQFFDKFAENGRMNAAAFDRFIEAIEIKMENPHVLFKQACSAVSAECTSLGPEEFSLHLLHANYTLLKALDVTKEKDPKSEKVCTLNTESVVEVLYGPITFDGLIRVKLCYEAEETIEGWATIRHDTEDFLVRYSPHYSVCDETVLTDHFSLKKFKVIRPSFIGEKLRALERPKFCKESSLWRIHASTTEKEKVWVTLQSSKGEPKLSNMSRVICTEEGGAKPSKFIQSKFNELCTQITKRQEVDIMVPINAAFDSKKRLEKMVADLKVMDQEGKELTQDEVSTLIQAVESEFTTHKQCSSKANMQIKSLLHNINNVENGPFFDFKEKLHKLVSELTSGCTEMAELREAQKRCAKSVVHKELQRRQAREKRIQEALTMKLFNDIKPWETRSDEMMKKLEDLDKRPLPSLSDSLKDYGDKLAKMKSDIQEILNDATEIKKWVDETTKNLNSVVLNSEAMAEVEKLSTRCQTANTKCALHSHQAKQLDINLKEKMRVDFALCLQAYLKKHEKTAAKMYEDSFNKASTVDTPTFAKFGKKICKEVQDFEGLLHYAVGSTSIGKEHFETLAKCNYRCVKRALLTDTLNVRSCKRLRRVEPEEMVEVVSKHEADPSSNLIRFKGRTVDGVEGYVTITGNKGSAFFRLQQNSYKVVRETVFTDRFPMVDFKVTRRLQEGDLVRALTPPTLEEKSNLWRLKVQCDSNDVEVGWVTLKSNQGTTFLVNADGIDDNMSDDDGTGDA